MLAVVVSTWSAHGTRIASISVSRRRASTMAPASPRGSRIANSSPPVRATTASSPTTAPIAPPMAWIMSSPAT
jgi:hypothetical protein